MNEGYRLSFGTLTRLPRVAPEDDLQFGNWVIPAGVCILAILLSNLRCVRTVRLEKMLITTIL
jgi:hypothetical protein